MKPPADAGALRLGPGRRDSAPRPLTPEDAARSRDRSRVYRAREHNRRWYLLWLLVGPGILAMLGENDGPSMISYATTGATYGLGFFLPFIVVTFVMAIVCQEMCMRVGAVTHRGYGALVLQRFGPVWGWFAAIDLLFTNLVTLVAEFVAIRIGLAYFHLGAPVAAALGVVLVVLHALGRALLALGAGRARPRDLQRPVPRRGDHGQAHWGTVGQSIGRSRRSRRQLQHPAAAGRLDDRRDGHALDGLLPAERLSRQGPDAARPHPGPHRHDHRRDARRDLRLRRADRRRRARRPWRREYPGPRRRRLPGALRAVSGPGVATVFALGLIEAGAVAVLTISASTGYAAAEAVGVRSSLNNSPRRAALFYTATAVVALIAAGVILIPAPRCSRSRSTRTSSPRSCSP